MSTIRVGNIGPLTGNTSVIADPGGAGGMSLVSMGAVTASGTSVDFTGIPSWVRRITVVFANLSQNGTAARRIQIGSGSITTSGYSVGAGWTGSSTGGTTSTSGFDMHGEGGASNSISGQLVLVTTGSNTWVGSGTFGHASQGTYVFFTSGSVTLSGTLDRVRLTTTNGTDTFDAGTINVMYE